MSEKCKTCDGTGSVPAEVETAEGPTLCPYIGAPCPDCPPMPERVIMVRESELEALREALEPFAETAEWDIADSEADSDAFRQMGPRAAVAGIVTVGHFRKAHEARARLDAALAHPTPDGCGREGRQIEAAARRIAEVVEEESEGGAAAYWKSCSGCHETVDGQETGHYPYSKAFGCYLGAGCRECGGIGAVWHHWTADALADMAREGGDDG